MQDDGRRSHRPSTCGSFSMKSHGSAACQPGRTGTAHASRSRALTVRQVTAPQGGPTSRTARPAVRDGLAREGVRDRDIVTRAALAEFAAKRFSAVLSPLGRTFPCATGVSPKSFTSARYCATMCPSAIRRPRTAGRSCRAARTARRARQAALGEMGSPRARRQAVPFVHGVRVRQPVRRAYAAMPPVTVEDLDQVQRGRAGLTAATRPLRAVVGTVPSTVHA
jgi:hypothetical protein